jgi:hypothetical protein
MVMLESLHNHCPEAHVHVLCLSEECHAAMQSLAYPHVSLLTLEELEAADAELKAVRPTRSPIEYYFTLTPCLPWYLLTQKKLEAITYLDADMIFFTSPEPLFGEAGEASVIITPHRFSSRLKDLCVYGTYNVSWLTFRNTQQGITCLAWYRKACIEWCRDIVEETRFADQKYLDVFSIKFQGIHVMRHLGGGLAPWNLDYARLAEIRGAYFVGGEPLIFYHAQGVKRLIGPFYSSGLKAYSTKLEDPVAKAILKQYVRAYAEAMTRALQLAPSQNLSGIRTVQKSKLRQLKNIKDILMEACGRSLVWL